MMYSDTQSTEKQLFHRQVHQVLYLDAGVEAYTGNVRVFLYVCVVCVSCVRGVATGARGRDPECVQGEAVD